MGAIIWGEDEEEKHPMSGYSADYQKSLHAQAVARTRSEFTMIELIPQLMFPVEHARYKRQYLLIHLWKR